mmetsp:Transcript_6191/g.7799  ORF Transcript_6191/g.7799 Transcript_6191/m.7799 type:complete len:100 (-) Transcript_6191:175-474(-)
MKSPRWMKNSPLELGRTDKFTFSSLILSSSSSSNMSPIMKNVVVVELFGFELVGGGDVVGDAVFDAVFDAVDIAVSDVVGIEVGPLVGDGVGSELTEYL